jgi:hypothetical protein
MVVGKRNPPRSNRGRRAQEASPEQPSSTSGAPAAEAPVVPPQDDETCRDAPHDMGGPWSEESPQRVEANGSRRRGKKIDLSSLSQSLPSSTSGANAAEAHEVSPQDEACRDPHLDTGDPLSEESPQSVKAKGSRRRRSRIDSPSSSEVSPVGAGGVPPPVSRVHEEPVPSHETASAAKPDDEGTSAQEAGCAAEEQLPSEDAEQRSHHLRAMQSFLKKADQRNRLLKQAYRSGSASDLMKACKVVFELPRGSMGSGFRNMRWDLQGVRARWIVLVRLLSTDKLGAFPSLQPMADDFTRASQMLNELWPGLRKRLMQQEGGSGNADDMDGAQESAAESDGESAGSGAREPPPGRAPPHAEAEKEPTPAELFLRADPEQPDGDPMPYTLSCTIVARQRPRVQHSTSNPSHSLAQLCSLSALSHLVNRLRPGAM